MGELEALGTSWSMSMSDSSTARGRCLRSETEFTQNSV